MPEFAATIELSALNGVNGFQISGEAAGDYSGSSVSNAGDVNGDGFDDVIVGAYAADPNGSGSGASYVVFGKASSFAANLNLSALNGRNGFQISGESNYEGAGVRVSSAGDVNGDGIDDVVIGAPGADPNGSHTGASYVVFGKASAFAANLNLSLLNGGNGFQISGESSSDTARRVSSAGDVNGDGFDDVIIGASIADPSGSHSGVSYVVFGKASGFSANLDLSALNGGNGFQISGGSNNDSGGDQVSRAGDVNGDGFDDLFIGALEADPSGHFRGACYVVFGKASGFAADLDLSSLNGANGFRISSEAANDDSGRDLSAGDINGDGFSDLIIGARHATPNGRSSGATYVVFGKDSRYAANLNLSSLNGGNGFQISGEAAEDYSGESVSIAGDVNGDGFDDLLIGAPAADPNGSRSGASYVVFGKASGFAANLNLSSLNGANGFQINGELDDDHSSGSVSSAGDVNGDGFDDLIVGADDADQNASDSGASYVIFGHRADMAVTRVGTALAQTINGGRGDDRIDGLGGNDILIGWEGGDAMFGGIGRDELAAGAGNDTLSGDNGNDFLGGSNGNDNLVGGTGADRLSGGNDADALNGGAGRDTLTGGTHTDHFVFATANWGGDTIADFQDGVDVLRFKRFIADNISDFAITGNGTRHVTLAIGAHTLALDGAAAITLTNADFQFLA